MFARVEFGRIDVESEQGWWRVVAVVVVDGVTDHVLGEADQRTVLVLERSERIPVERRPEVTNCPMEVAIEVAQVRSTGAADYLLRAEHHVAVGRPCLVDDLIVAVGKSIFIESEFEIAAVHLLGQPECTALVERRVNDGVVVTRDFRVVLHGDVVGRWSVRCRGWSYLNAICPIIYDVR